MRKKKYIVHILFYSCILVFLIIAFSWADTYHVVSKLNIDNLKNSQVIPWGVKYTNTIYNNLDITGRGVKVAIFDSGISFNHPDFGSNIKEGYNAINPNTLPYDDFGHGTLVAGIICAQDNKIGIVGVAQDAEIYPVKVLDKYGEGNISDIERGIDWCIKNNINIINMSFAIDKDNPLLRNSISRAIDSGIIVIASAMNSYGGGVGYPASYEKVISVTSIDENYKIGDTSPKGKIDFAAPGVNIISTSSDGSYKKLSGTSLAAPYVTGLVSLILENPEKFGLSKGNISYESIYSILKKFSKDLGKKGKDNIFGEGFIAFPN